MMAVLTTSCEKDESDNPESCTGIASAQATGEVSINLCFNEEKHFNYEQGSLIYIGCIQTGDPIYSLTVSVNTYGLAGVPDLLVPGTYSCDIDDSESAGYVELVVHGDENEFFKSQSGTVTITEMSDNSFQATFNVVTKGYNNGGTLSLSGLINK